MGMRVEAVWKPPRAVGHHGGEHRPLPPHRRARRAVRVVRPPPVKDGHRDGRRRRRVRAVAVRPPQRQHHQRRRDARADLRRGARGAPAWPRTTSASGARAPRTTWPGRAFSFVQAVDAIGAFPPIMESHVEMDGAWALYEAWVKILTGEATPRWSTASASRRRATLRRVLALQLDPYLLAPLWPDSVSIAALQARAGLDAGLWTEKEMAEVAVRSRGRGAGQPAGAARPARSPPTELLAAPYVADPLRAHDCAPVSDGAAVVDPGRRRPGPRAVPTRPAWITGHRPPHRLGGARRARPHRPRRRPAPRPRGRRAPTRRRRRRAARAVHPPGAPAARRARAWPTTSRVNPSGGALCGQPDVRRRAGPDRRGRGPRSSSGQADRAAGPRHQRARPAAEPGLRDGRRRPDGARQRAAVLGVGQTQHQRARGPTCRSPASCREAVGPRPGRRRAHAGPTSTPSSSARRPTCSRA